MLRNTSGTYWITGCAHAPWQNKRMYESTFNYLSKEVKLQGIILAGDIADMNSLSSHDRGKKPLPGVTLDWEYKQTSKFLDEIDSLGAKTTDYLYGNHCYDKETKFLTRYGFKHFDELLPTDEVGQFDENMNISFALPLRYLKHRYEGEIYEISTPYSNQAVTDLHNVVISGKSLFKVKAKDITLEDLKHIPQQASYRQVEHSVSLDWIRLMTWVVCDGTLVDFRKYNTGSSKRRVQFKLSKTRKIERLKELLDRLGVSYTFKECKKTGCNVLQPYYIRIYGDDARTIFDMLSDSKKFPKWFTKLNTIQSLAVIEEIKHTDGNFRDGGINWVTTSREDILTIQHLCINNSILFNYREYPNHNSGFANGKLQYKARINTTNGGHRNSNKITKIPYNDLVYCVEMPLGTVITARKGKIAFSGNCDRYNRAMNDIDTSKLGEALKSPIEGLGLLKRKYHVQTDWKNDSVKLGKHLDVCHGEFLNVHSAKKTIDTYRKSTLYFHTHRFQIYMEGMVAGWNMGAGADFKAPIFGYATRAMKNSWVNASCLVNLDKDGFYHTQPMIFMNNKLVINGKKY